MTSLLSPPGCFVAQQRKMVHDSSAHVYPNSGKSDDIDPALTSYVIDFAKKEGKPALPRPCSVTRRNRPHPSQNFLNWRIPSAPPASHKTSNANKAFLNLSLLETKERFYDEYVGRFNSEKHVLCKEIGSLSPCYPTRSKLPQSAGLKGEPNEERSCPRRCTVLPLCISKDAGHKYDSLVSRTPSKEKRIVESCLDAGDIGYIRKNFAYVVRPEAIPAIHQWLKSQDETVRDVVFRFFNKLNGNSTRNQDREMDRKSCKFRRFIGKKTTEEISRTGRNLITDQVRQKLSKGKQAIKCPTLRRSSKSKRRPMISAEDLITNKSTMFMQPHRCLPGQFEIHPEFHFNRFGKNLAVF
ncbi:uncharacterized protein LOC111334058 isoform X1 [Stylophora pistillata]|nr:uncharacterized protein LOC111334058 isoform X1 [Stylophora pistillata]